MTFLTRARYLKGAAGVRVEDRMGVLRQLPCCPMSIEVLLYPLGSRKGTSWLAIELKTVNLARGHGRLAVCSR